MASRPPSRLPNPLPSPVDKIIQDGQVADLELLPEGPAGGRGDDVGAPLLPEGPHVRPVVHLRGVDVVLAAVPREEHARHPLDLALDEGVTRLPEHGRHPLLGAVLEDVGVVEARTADYAHLEGSGWPGSQGKHERVLVFENFRSGKFWMVLQWNHLKTVVHNQLKVLKAKSKKQVFILTPYSNAEH